jgi:hypothetical protein
MENNDEDGLDVFDKIGVEVVTIMRIHNEDGTTTLDINHDGIDEDLAIALLSRAVVAMGQLTIEEIEDDE